VAVSRVISLTAWNLAYFGVLLLKEYHSVKLEASEARLAVRAGELAQLRSQINPHFLLNSLNSVVAEKADPGKVESMVLSLAGYLRFSLQQGSDLAPLGNELDALEDYLKVEKIRFEEKFEFEVEAESAARDHKVPNALILPLVENAVKYGRLTSEWPLRLRIHARVESGCLNIEVSNSGRWVDSADSAGSGIGLSNLRKRLKLLYPGNATLRIDAHDSLVCVRLSLPIDLVPLLP
jgi:LytS/YehU family sensor histidine kinase